MFRRVKIGKNSYFGPNSTVRNGIKIGENAKVSMGSVVTKNVEANQTVTGNFARIHQEYLKYMKYISEILKIKDVKKMKGGYRE